MVGIVADCGWRRRWRQVGEVSNRGKAERSYLKPGRPQDLRLTTARMFTGLVNDLRRATVASIYSRGFRRSNVWGQSWISSVTKEGAR